MEDNPIPGLIRGALTLAATGAGRAATDAARRYLQAHAESLLVDDVVKANLAIEELLAGALGEAYAIQVARQLHPHSHAAFQVLVDERAALIGEGIRHYADQLRRGRVLQGPDRG